MKKLILLLTILAITALNSQAQRPYSIVIKGGHVIDPKNNINGLMDVAIEPATTAGNGLPAQEARIALIAKNIDTAMAVQVVHAKGMYVTPGLIDVHAHVFYGPHRENYLSNGSVAVVPDGHTFKAGVTTVVDAGGAGYKSFALFKKNIIDLSQTRVLSLLNIVGEGMRGGAYEQNLNDMDVQRAVDTALAYKEHVVGFKLAHFTAPDWTPIQRITEAGRKANMPVMIDFGGGRLSIEELFTKYLRPGDIYTHVYTELARRDPVVDFETRKLKPFVLDAQKRGIVFDVGFGSGSFDFRQAIPAIKAGFYPNTMGTDLHTSSIVGSMKDELNMMSIFLAMGMNIQDIIKAATWGSAQAIKREELGNLSAGGIADIAILSMRQGKFGFRDIAGNRQGGTQKFECEITIKGGRIVYDLNAIAGTPVAK
ncbi:MAG: amidohydrolase/deacetylase family metallohydrolase [Daejeonella sp.]|uniref:amidohydrolase/deacetylase family metallohydrolase n=1 Tax=Daejeonella sp. JGW-45 TaxID=3034148 RepID=UPI0023ECABA8|nr:amidohydrolase/deacetylase family metallohydrolase [Daejeonella sp. JGW-45]